MRKKLKHEWDSQDDTMVEKDENKTREELYDGGKNYLVSAALLGLWFDGTNFCLLGPLSTTSPSLDMKWNKKLIIKKKKTIGKGEGRTISNEL